MTEVFLMVATYTESLLNNRSTHNGHYDSLYRIHTFVGPEAFLFSFDDD